VCVCVCVCVFVTCLNRFAGVGEERVMTRGCVLTFLWGRLHREKKDWEKKCFPITSPAHHREKKFFFRDRKILGGLLNFIFWSMPQWSFWEANIFHKFCSFWSCVLTFLYGRLHREKKDWEKKGKCFKLTLHHRPYTERRNIKRKKN